MDITVLKEKYRKIFFGKRGLYIIRPERSSVHRVDKSGQRATDPISRNLNHGAPLYKIGLSGAKGSKQGLLGRFNNFCTLFPNGFKVHAVFFKKETDLFSSETKFKTYLEQNGLKYRQIVPESALSTNIGKSEWTGASLPQIKQILLDNHLKGPSNNMHAWFFDNNDATLMVGPDKGKKLSSIDQSKLKNKPLPSDDAKYIPPRMRSRMNLRS